jgi:hypothetical protein
VSKGNGRPAGGGPNGSSCASAHGLSVLSAALSIAEEGWLVLPCVPGGERAKAPLIARGHLAASGDPQKIRRWWGRWPDAMLGLAIRSDLVVFDVDPRNGGSVEALERCLGPLPTTLTVWSGRGDGGCHLYFARPPGPLSAWRIPVGIDLKLDGYCIAPPSLHPDTRKPYRWEAVAHALLPRRAVEAMIPRQWGAPLASDRDSADRVPAVAAVYTRGSAYGRAALLIEAAAVADTPSGRNNRLHLAAFRCGQLIAAGHLSGSFTFGTLLDAATECGLVDDDGDTSCRATIISGIDAGLRRPRVGMAAEGG